MRTINLSEFVEDFSPIKNHLNDQADYHGYLLGLEGQEYHRVMTFMQEAPDQVWTLVNDGQNPPVLQCGFTTINRIGHVITLEAADGYVEVLAD